MISTLCRPHVHLALFTCQKRNKPKCAQPKHPKRCLPYRGFLGVPSRLVPEVFRFFLGGGFLFCTSETFRRSVCAAQHCRLGCSAPTYRLLQPSHNQIPGNWRVVRDNLSHQWVRPPSDGSGTTTMLLPGFDYNNFSRSRCIS